MAGKGSLHRLGGCAHCEGWGLIGPSGRCAKCNRWWVDSRVPPTVGCCRRCRRRTPVNYEGVCRPCLIEIRYHDDAWVRAERALLPPPVTDLQLSFLLPEVRLASMQPLRKNSKSAKLRLLPRTRNWKETHELADLLDDPSVCPVQVAGQIALLRIPRTFRAGQAARITGRTPAGFDLAQAVVFRIGRERKLHPRWPQAVLPGVRLALAGQDEEDGLVDEEDLDSLPADRDTVVQVLREIGRLRERADPRRPKTPVAEPRRPKTPVADPPRRRGRDREPRVSSRPPRPFRSCEHCMAWIGQGPQVCPGCYEWLYRGRLLAVCARCGRTAHTNSAGHCRLCWRSVAVGAPADRVQDQLWFGPLAPPPAQHLPGEATPRVSEHLVDPGQTALFPCPPRQWSLLRQHPRPAMTAEAERMLEELNQLGLDQQWGVPTRRANLRVLRLLLEYLGPAPIEEVDVQAVARLGTNYAGLRVAHFLEARGLLIPQPGRDVGMDEAAVARLIDTAPQCFRPQLQVWVRVMRGQGRLPSPAKEWATIRRYLGYVLPVLKQWDGRFEDLRQVESKNIRDAVAQRQGAAARSVHCGLRSVFRALKRERVIFHDPARTVHIQSGDGQPRPIASDRIAGLLDTVPTAFGRLCVALVAIHAVRPLTLPRLLTSQLDRSKGRLLAGDRTVYLDPFTLQLCADWGAERHRQWPHMLRDPRFGDGTTLVVMMNGSSSRDSVAMVPAVVCDDTMATDHRSRLRPVRDSRGRGLWITTLSRRVAVTARSRIVDRSLAIKTVREDSATPTASGASSLER